jgi:hypothetical protein
VCELQPGDVLFVPAGTPHAVRNVGDGPALSLSANYIDSTNLPHALGELELAALTDERALALLEELRSAAPPCAYEIGEHVPFAEYKLGDPSAGGRWPALDHAALEREAAAHVRAVGCGAGGGADSGLAPSVPGSVPSQDSPPDMDAVARAPAVDDPTAAPGMPDLAAESEFDLD